MKTNKLPIITAALLIGAIACGEAKKTESNENKKGVETIKEKKKEGTSFFYNNDSTIISWEAYKTTEKKGVQGQFTSFEIKGTKEALTTTEVFSEASFVIQANSVTTGNEIRDNRIVQNFFNVFVNTATIIGKVNSLNDTTGVLEISLNDMTKEVPVKVVTEGNKFTLEGKIELGLFNGQPAIDSLNYVCKDVHKGADGITKLWPDVAIKVSTVMKTK